MPRELKVIHGIKINKPIDTLEGFYVQVDEQNNKYTVVANIGADKLTRVFKELVKSLEGLLKVEIVHSDSDSKEHVFKSDFEPANWSDEEIDWILQDGLTSIRVFDSNQEDVFMGPLQVCYCNTVNLKAVKNCLKRNFVRQKTHLKTLYSVAQDESYLLEKQGLKLNRVSLTPFLEAKFS